MRSGVVSIVGRPNVGKSTLLNTLLERKLAITSDKAETTRNTILGVYNDDDVQIVFVDTPGIHKPLNRLGTVLNQTAFHAIQDVDVVLFLVDAKTGIGKGDLFILNRLKEANAKVILVLNKIDGMKKDDIFLAIQKASQAYDFVEVVPISALKEKNIKEISALLCAKECEAAEAVARLKEEAKEQKEKLGILQQKLLKAQAKEIPVEDMTLVFDAGLSGNGPRELMNLLLDRGAEICMVFAGLLLGASGLLTFSTALYVTQYPYLFTSYPLVAAWADVVTPLLGGIWLVVYGVRAVLGYGLRRGRVGSALAAGVLPLCLLWRLVWRFQFVPASLQRMPCTLRVVSGVAALLFAVVLLKVFLVPGLPCGHTLFAAGSGCFLLCTGLELTQTLFEAFRGMLILPDLLTGLGIGVLGLCGLACAWAACGEDANETE